MREVAWMAVAAMVLAGCSTGDDMGSGEPANDEPTTETSPEPTTTMQKGPPPATGTAIKVSASEFGPMLFDKSGQAIYLFDKEKSSKPECYGECAEAWPPVLTKGKPQAAGKVQADLLGTAKRTDGKTQVTYNGHPLYFYAHEGKNEVECHNVNLNGGFWYVVTPKGDAAPA